jgi:hypothetical protein
MSVLAVAGLTITITCGAVVLALAAYAFKRPKLHSVDGGIRFYPAMMGTGMVTMGAAIGSSVALPTVTIIPVVMALVQLVVCALVVIEIRQSKRVQH